MNATRYQQVDGFAALDIGDQVWLVGPDGTAAAEVNETALALWEQCDGRTTLDEIVRAVVDLFGLDPDEARAQVHATLDALVAAGVLEAVPGG